MNTTPVEVAAIKKNSTIVLTMRRLPAPTGDEGAAHMNLGQRQPSGGVQQPRAINSPYPHCRSRAVSNLLFFRRSLAYRSVAVEIMRKARATPPGSERRAARQLARALKDLAKTEAWLEGQTLRPGPMAHNRHPSRSAVS
jgi:hypothetical protein